jgi:hypothetical protein
MAAPPGKTRTVKLELNGTGRALLRADHWRLGASLTILKSFPAPSQRHAESVRLVLDKLRVRRRNNSLIRRLCSRRPVRLVVALCCVLMAGLLFSSAQALAAEPVSNITGVTPEHGTPTGGTKVTITGSNFTGAIAVHFGSNEATSFNVESDTKITATTPAFSGGPEDGVGVYVTTPGGTNTSEECGHPVGYRYEPTITTVEPSSGPAAGGTHVTIRGAAFEGTKWGGGALCSLAIPVVQGVKFGSKEATHWNVESDREITAVAPAGYGTVDVAIESVVGTSPIVSADRFSYVEPEARPVVLGESASGETRTGVTLSGLVNPENGATYYTFEYGTTASYGSSTGEGPVGAKTGEVAVGPTTISGLVPGTTYHYRLLAGNASGTSAGEDETLTTLPLTPPLVSTGAASGISQVAVTISATIDPQGLNSTYEFELGPTTGYGTKVFGVAGQRTVPETVAVSVPFLAPGVTYHYRIQASNSDGTAYGADETFTTSIYPVLTPAVAITQPPEKADPKALTRAQKLAKALKACKSERSARKRASCEKRAHKRYGPSKRKTTKKH